MSEPTMQDVAKLAIEYRRLVLDDDLGAPTARAARERLFAAIDRLPGLARRCIRANAAAPALGKPSLELAIFMVHERCRREMTPTLKIGGNDVGGRFDLTSFSSDRKGAQQA